MDIYSGFGMVEPPCGKNLDCRVWPFGKKSILEDRSLPSRCPGACSWFPAWLEVNFVETRKMISWKAEMLRETGSAAELGAKNRC